MKIELLKYKIKKIICPNLISSKEYIAYLSSKGVFLGTGCHFFYPYSNTIDIQRPWLLSIGNYCKITEGVKILTHDYSRSVLRMKFGGAINTDVEKTRIGNNVFVGMNSIILMGADIGDNVIIGAGAVVKGKIPNNTVIAGVPAKVICSLDEYYKKKKNNTLKEAVSYFKSFCDFYKREPLMSEMGAFFPLFLRRTKEALENNGISVKCSGDNQEDLINCFMKSNPVFESYDSFKKYVYSCK